MPTWFTFIQNHVRTFRFFSITLWVISIPNVKIIQRLKSEKEVLRCSHITQIHHLFHSSSTHSKVWKYELLNWNFNIQLQKVYNAWTTLGPRVVHAESVSRLGNVWRPSYVISVQNCRFAVKEKYPLDRAKTSYEAPSADALKEILANSRPGDNLKKILNPNLGK